MDKILKTPELLSPAGNFEKMKSAILYGANAVYLAGDDFGMRAAADNFTLEELSAAVQYAHERGVRVNLTLNTMPRSGEYPRLTEFVKNISNFGIDAVIVADIGVMALVKKYIPSAELHVSTQASTVSAAACLEWAKLGAKRVVLARELSLDEIREIREATRGIIEIETFIHGSMCISYSGRCLLSQYFVDRDANRGRCAQPCRWNMTMEEAMRVSTVGYEGTADYEIMEEKRPENRIPVMENSEGTFFLSSKDMCMIEHIPELVESGIDCFKIEGRMKSEYYAAAVTNVYRMAIDKYIENPKEYKVQPEWLRELESVSHREYDTGYYFTSPMENANTTKFPGYMKEKAFLCRVADYDEEIQTATFIQRNKVFANSDVEIISPGKVGRRLHLGELYLESGEVIESAPHPYMIFKAKVPFEVKAGDIVRGI